MRLSICRSRTRKRNCPFVPIKNPSNNNERSLNPSIVEFLSTRMGNCGSRVRRSRTQKRGCQRVHEQKFFEEIYVPFSRSDPEYTSDTCATLGDLLEQDKKNFQDHRKYKLRVSSPPQIFLELGVAALVGGARLRVAHTGEHPSGVGEHDPPGKRPKKQAGRQGSEGVRSPRPS